MKRFHNFLFFLILFFPFLAKAQSGISTDVTAPYDDVEYLIDEVLSDGTADISNVTYTFGRPDQIGYFYDSNIGPVLGFEEGVFMATGGPGTINGIDPANGNGAQSAIQDVDLDLSLQLLFGGSYNPAIHDQQNLAIIEFDIVAGLDFFEFWYVFASREYQSFTCSGFNDVFGFYVSGPNPNSSTPYSQENIALIPTDTFQTAFTSTPVAINSLNAGLLPNDQDCINANPNFVNDSIFFVSNSNSSPVDFSFTGFTVPLKAYIPAVCGETYHMKLAIADVSDGALNSAVFLQESSLRSPVDVSLETAPNIYPDTNGWFYEGCGTSILKFKRPTMEAFAPGTGDLLVNFELLGDADYGDDFTFLNNPYTDHLYIPDTANEFILNIDVINDGLVEGPEVLIIRVPHITGHGCGSQDSGWVDFELTIQDYPEIELDLVDEINISCPGEEVNFEVFISGGIPLNDPIKDYNVHWSQIGYSPSQTVYPEVTTTYYVEVSDLCPENGVRDSVIVNVLNWPELKVSKLHDEFVCTDIAQHYNILDSNIVGGDGEYTYIWTNTLDSSYVSSQKDPALFPGTYRVTVFDGCGSFDRREVTIYHYEAPAVEIHANEVGGERNIELSLSDFPLSLNYLGYMPVDYEWDLGDGSPIVNTKGKFIHTYPEYGFYTVKVKITNDRGCQKEFTRDIEVSPLINIPTVFTPNGDGVNEGYAPLCSRDVESYEFHIYDRWGKELFTSTELSEKWFGKSKDGFVCGEGIYVYKMYIKYPLYEKTEYYEGVFHLSR